MCFAIEMKQVECATCGAVFGITAAFHSRRLDDGENFYCPSGHRNIFRPSTVERMRRDLAEKEIAIKRAGDANANALSELASAKRKIAKLTKKLAPKKPRVKHG